MCGQSSWRGVWIMGWKLFRVDYVVGACYGLFFWCCFAVGAAVWRMLVDVAV
jgi:hypothetical protein